MKQSDSQRINETTTWHKYVGICLLSAFVVVLLMLAWQLLLYTPGTEASAPSMSPPVAIPTPQPPAPPATPVPTPTPISTPQPTPAPPWSPAQGAYTIAWMSDTQYYSERFPDTFRTMTRFLRDKKDALNLKYVVHTGDIVQDYNNEAQWRAAYDAMRRLDSIPYGVLAGNHDMGGSSPNYKYFSQYFGEETMRRRSYYGGSYQNNRGHYDLINIGSTAYVFVYMSFEPDAAAIDWIRDVFAHFPDRVGVLCVHDYYTTAVKLGKSGKLLYERVVAESPNLYLVLCGHRYALAHREASFDDDGDGTKERTVYQIIMNYQAAGEEGGSGYLRLMQVNEAAREIRMQSYSPLKDDFNYFDEPATQLERYPSDPANEAFTIPIPWPLQPLGNAY